MDPRNPYSQGNLPQNHLINFLEEGFFMLAWDLDSDDEDETKDAECEDEFMDKPVIDADIVTFTQILAEAQLAAVRKYYKHWTLPPKVLRKLKNEFHVKYGHD
jgi:hypothetical protein